MHKILGFAVRAAEQAGLSTRSVCASTPFEAYFLLIFETLHKPEAPYRVEKAFLSRGGPIPQVAMGVNFDPQEVLGRS